MAVGRMYDRLIKHFSIDKVFRDLDSLPIGKPFPQALEEAVANAKVALIIIGSSWASITDANGEQRLGNPTDFVRLEVEKALAASLPVVPVLVNRATMPSAVDLPESLRPLVLHHGVEVRPDPDFHSDMERLIGKLSAILIEPNEPRHQGHADQVAGARSWNHANDPYCPACGGWRNPDSDSCSRCKRKIYSYPDLTCYQARCGHFMPPVFAYCTVCGEKNIQA